MEVHHFRRGTAMGVEVSHVRVVVGADGPARENIPGARY